MQSELSLLEQIKLQKIWTFPGGIHPPEQKELSNQTPIINLPLSQKYYVPVKQHIGSVDDVIVTVGEQVVANQPLTAANLTRTVPVHAPVAGRVIAIAPHVSAHPSAKPELSVIIEEASNTIFCETQAEENLLFDHQPYKEPEIDLSSVIATEQSTDLSYFRDLMCKIEECNPNWIGRGDRILNLCVAMNKEAGYPVDAKQLEAAVFMHDFGMTFLPFSPLDKQGELDELERRKMQEHPLLGAELLYRIGHWDGAAKIVMQHHERQGGMGYPEGISGNSICDGAKILAIADALVAMTIKQSYRDYRRPVMRAIIEINSCKRAQFSEYWVEIFNTVIKSYKKLIVDQEEDKIRIVG